MPSEFRTLLIMRHAKSDWNSPAGDDHSRPLNARGTKAARRMGTRLAEAKWKPGLVLCSSAVRALTTAQLVCDAGEFHAPLEVHDSLYETTAKSALEVLKSCVNTAHTALVCGHEPTSSQLVSLLIGGGALRFPTAAIACVRTRVYRWDELAPNSAELRWFWTPR